MERRHFLGQCCLGRKDPPGPERELLRIAVHVRVTVAGMRRDLEIHGRRRLGCFREDRPAPAQGSRGNGPLQDIASWRHGFLANTISEPGLTDKISE